MNYIFQTDSLGFVIAAEALFLVAVLALASAIVVRARSHRAMSALLATSAAAMLWSGVVQVVGGTDRTAALCGALLIAAGAGVLGSRFGARAGWLGGRLALATELCALHAEEHGHRVDAVSDALLTVIDSGGGAPGAEDSTRVAR